MPRTKETIVRLLGNLGGWKEVEQYLRHYASLQSQKFAIIEVGGDVLATALDSLVSSLGFLQDVGLYPIVIHGVEPQLVRKLAARGVTPDVDGGRRVVSSAVLAAAREVFAAENMRLVDALDAAGHAARPILHGVFEAEATDGARLGLDGQVTRVRLEPIRSAIRARALPILAPLGVTAEGQLLHLDAGQATRALALAGKPHKVVYLVDEGGLLGADGRVISTINLAEDADELLDPDGATVDGATRGRLRETAELLADLPHTSSVAFTRPETLAAELFTHRGSGTLVRAGEAVRDAESFGDVDRARLRSLLEACFGRQLKESYFEDKEPYRLYVAESYRAAAILTREGDVPYLDKFAVSRAAQGAGTGASLWKRIRRDNPKLFWRARPDNSVNPWYFGQAQGTWREGDWVVFWYGLDGLDEMQACIRRALSMPASIGASARAPAEV